MAVTEGKIHAVGTLEDMDTTGPLGPVPTGIEPAKALPIDAGFEDDEEAILVILLGD